jgi:predicted HicB family RNase H-like nuclease
MDLESEQPVWGPPEPGLPGMQGYKQKRIIDGKAYNTETAVIVWAVEDEGPFSGGSGLYRTKHGAFFLAWESAEFDASGIKPLTDEQALQWLELHDASADLLEQLFGPFPEGGAAEVRVSLRLPGTLHQQMVAAAAAQGVSLNTYAMRALQRFHTPAIG